jgi:DNA excision repair protein ERCC-8
VHHPVGTIPKSPEGHRFGITKLSFYPVDPGAFLSSSYDKTVQVWDTETLQSAISFPVPGQVYAHDISPIASHLLVAVAVQDSFVRLIDLESGASTHTLPGHEGAVLSVAWSPVREHILVSAGSDGTVRLWDIRSAGNILGTLDYEDSVGILRSRVATRDIASARQRYDAKAHIGPCNGVVFSADGSHIISCGHDERIRVWDASTGANTLVHFGPTIRNRVLASLTPTPVPPDMTESGHELMLFPNGPEVLLLDMHEGTLLHRLRPVPGVAARAKGEKGLKQRVTDVCWRPGHCEAYSAHSTGFIKAWVPQTSEDDVDESDDGQEQDEQTRLEDELDGGGDRKRRREDLQRMYRDLMKQKITFT